MDCATLLMRDNFQLSFIYNYITLQQVFVKYFEIYLYKSQTLCSLIV